jgi:hypothetical protein
VQEEYRQYAEKSYPSNHSYKIKEQSLSPKCKLWVRYKKLSRLYPSPLTSLLDIGCSKGFFVFSAHQKHHATRNLGIDVTPYDIEYCNYMKTYLKDDAARFELMQMHELADKIDEFGGPFQTALIVNTYQYLYFGSVRSSACYLNHDEIFKNLRKVCSGRVIFNNRVNVADCQNRDLVKQASIVEQNNYSEDNILAAASKYFNVKKMGKIGSYPLWVMDAK